MQGCYDQIGLPHDRRKYDKIGHRERDASLDLLRGHYVLDNYIVSRASRSDQHMRDLAELLLVSGLLIIGYRGARYRQTVSIEYLFKEASLQGGKQPDGEIHFTRGHCFVHAELWNTYNLNSDLRRLLLKIRKIGGNRTISPISVI